MRRDAGWAFFFLETFTAHTYRSLHTYSYKGILVSSTEVSKRRLRAGGTSGFNYLMTIRFWDLVLSTLVRIWWAIYNVFDFLFILFIPYIARVREYFGNVCWGWIGIDFSQSGYIIDRYLR